MQMYFYLNEKENKEEEKYAKLDKFQWVLLLKEYLEQHKWKIAKKLGKMVVPFKFQ